MGTCELLIGIPALKEMKAQIDCDIGVMSYVDGDDQVQVFGKNRSLIADLDGYSSSALERREKCERDAPPTKALVGGGRCTTQKQSAHRRH